MEHATFIYFYVVILLPISVMIVLVPFLPVKVMKYSELTLSCNAQAVRRGYPMFLVRTMLSFQHLTICTMLLVTVYVTLLAWGYSVNNPGKYAHVLCSIRPILPGAGIIVAQYWSFIFAFGPWSLVPREEFPSNPKTAMQIAHCCFMYPSATRYVFFYILMHIQHTFIPLMAWIEELLFLESVHSICPHPPLWRQITLTLSYLFAWLLWGLSCWYVRGRPPYPILKEVHQKGYWPVLYGGMIFLAVMASRVHYFFFNNLIEI